MQGQGVLSFVVFHTGFCAWQPQTIQDGYDAQLVNIGKVRM